jgi:hypothetical protein
VAAASVPAGYIGGPASKCAILNRRSRCISARLVISGGLRCPDLIQRHQAFIELGGVVLSQVPSFANFSRLSKMEQRREDRGLRVSGSRSRLAINR